jgi:hypothetical protein
MLSWTGSCLAPSPTTATTSPVSSETLPPTPCQQEYALAAFEQGDWLAELDLLQLGNALQRSVRGRGGHDGRAFDLMFAIADVLGAEHGRRARLPSGLSRSTLLACAWLKGFKERVSQPLADRTRDAPRDPAMFEGVFLGGGGGAPKRLAQLTSSQHVLGLVPAWCKRLPAA